MIRIGFTEIVLFVAPFVLYVVFLWATKAGVMHPDSWPVSRIVWLAIAALLLVVGSFIYFSHFSGAPLGLDLCAGAHGERQIRAGADQVTATARSLAGAAWLEAGALPRLLGVLDGHGEEARVVGGAVRNALIGMPIHEIDVATTATPDEVVKRVTAAGFKAVPTGIEHGTVTVVIDKHPFEVTTLRQDVETYGRHAKVAFGRDWKADAERRDFTINALSATRDGAVYDYVGGLADLEARRVRFIGDARTSASRKITCAFCASSVSTPPTAPAAIPTPRASPPASPAATGSINCRANACAWR